MRIPVTKPRRATNQRLAMIAASGTRRPRGGPVDDAPEEKELPGLGHPERQERRDGDDGEGSRDDPPHAEALDESGGERRAEAEAEQVEGDGEADRLVAPAELVVERNEQDACGRPKPADMTRAMKPTPTTTQA